MIFNPHSIPSEYLFEIKGESILDVGTLFVKEAEALRELVKLYTPESRRYPDPRPLSRTAKEQIFSNSKILETLTPAIVNKIKENWVVPGELKLSEAGFFIYEKGERFGLHSDNSDLRNILWAPHRKFTCLFYLYDSLDNGGELVIYPKVKPGPTSQVKIAPRAGQLVIFPSNIYYPHESLAVKSGVKVMLALFMDVI